MTQLLLTSFDSMGDRVFHMDAAIDALVMLAISNLAMTSCINGGLDSTVL